nr:hypothetical protein Iba_chr10bCG11990 [Ipomoea batatas]
MKSKLLSVPERFKFSSFISLTAPALVQLMPVQFQQTLSRLAMDHERRTSSVLDKVFFHSTRALPCVLSDDVVSQGTEELGLGYPNCCWIKVSLRVTAEDCIVIPEYLLSANWSGEKDISVRLGNETKSKLSSVPERLKLSNVISETTRNNSNIAAIDACPVPTNVVKINNGP